VITRVFQRVSIQVNLNMTVGQAACQLLRRYAQRPLAASCDCDVWLYQKNLWLFMFEMHLISGILTNRPLAKLIVKAGPQRSLYFGIYYSFGFSGLLFFLHFSECFPVILGFCIAVQYLVYYCFLTIFWVLASGLPSTKFHHGSNL